MIYVKKKMSTADVLPHGTQSHYFSPTYGLHAGGRGNFGKLWIQGMIYTRQRLVVDEKWSRPNEN